MPTEWLIITSPDCTQVIHSCPVPSLVNTRASEFELLMVTGKPRSSEYESVDVS